MIKLLILLLSSFSGTVAIPVDDSAQVQPVTELSFESQVDMTPFNEVAVWDGGRIKSWESFSRSMMQFVSGSRKIDGQSPAFTYLDMALRSGAYENRDIIFVKKKPMRAAIIRALVDGDRPESATDERLETFMQSGLIAKEFILNRSVVELLASMQGDVMRFAKPIEAIQTAVGVGQP